MSNIELEPWDGYSLSPLLALRPLGNDKFTTCCNQSNLGGEIFGGQYLANATAAALATGDGLAPHAFTGYFLKSADAQKPLLIDVERTREGRSFAHRRVVIKQAEKPVFVADVSLHNAEPNQPEHVRPMPTVAAPESLNSIRQLYEKHGEIAIGKLSARIPNSRTVDVFPLEQEEGIIRPGTSTDATVWLKIRTPVDSTDAAVHYTGAAFLTDFWVNSPARVTHAKTLFSGGTTSFSLNHGIWFHNTPNINDWFLFVIDGPVTTGGTGLCRGLLYSRSGQLIASTVQESLVRKTD